MIATAQGFSDAFGPFSFEGPARPAASNRLVGCDPAETSRTAEDQVSDLHALLAAADVPGPYLRVEKVATRHMSDVHKREHSGSIGLFRGRLDAAPAS